MTFPDDYKPRMKRSTTGLSDRFEVIEDMNISPSWPLPSGWRQEAQAALGRSYQRRRGAERNAFGVALEMVHNFTLVHMM